MSKSVRGMSHDTGVQNMPLPFSCFLARRFHLDLSLILLFLSFSVLDIVSTSLWWFALRSCVVLQSLPHHSLRKMTMGLLLNQTNRKIPPVPPEYFRPSFGLLVMKFVLFFFMSRAMLRRRTVTARGRKRCLSVLGSPCSCFGRPRRGAFPWADGN